MCNLRKGYNGIILCPSDYISQLVKLSVHLFVCFSKFHVWSIAFMRRKIIYLRFILGTKVACDLRVSYSLYKPEVIDKGQCHFITNLAVIQNMLYWGCESSLESHNFFSVSFKTGLFSYIPGLLSYFC